MSKLKPDDTLQETMFKMSEGNPGALAVLIRMLQKGEDGLIPILILDDMGIYGSKIWVGYKNDCGMDIDKYIEFIKKRKVKC